MGGQLTGAMNEIVNELTWVEISKEALTANIRQFRKLIGKDRILCPCIKANAYGHGLIDAGKLYLEAGADWLSVNSLYEATALREAGISAPIYILGYVPLAGLSDVVRLDCRIVIYNRETVDALAAVCADLDKTVQVHLKAETGNNRQGLAFDELVHFANYIKNTSDKIEIDGIATHFANIEDTTEHSYAEMQLDRFHKTIKMLEDAGHYIPVKHCANSAATLLFPKTYFDMVRPGIATYGMWPSHETLLSYEKEVGDGFEMHPAFTWKCKIAQVKKIPEGESIGYGCTFKTTRDTLLAILPVGYYDGYDRGVSGGHVLIRGKRAPIRGRVCMNILMVDVSDIPDVATEDEAILIGRDGTEEISAEKFADWAGTINYEVTTRVNDRIPRIYV